MKKKDIEESFMDYINGELSEDELKKILASSGEHKDKFEEIEEVKNIYLKLDNISVPEPGENLDKNFYNMLESISAVAALKENKSSIIKDKISGFIKSLTLPKISYAALLLVFGVLIGKWALPGSSDSQYDKVSSELRSMKEVMMLTMLQQSSPIERIKAVSSVNSLSDVDSRVSNALIETLNTDPNVNVRLATVEALSSFCQNPQVRQGLVQSIANQKSPLVQIALADLMVSIKEKQSIEPLKKLLEDKEIKYSVKTKIENCIAKL